MLFARTRPVALKRFAFIAATLILPLPLFSNIPHRLFELTPGAHQLTVSATHPSGQFTTNQSVWFTNNAANERVLDSYDSAGLLTRRLWTSPNGQTNRTQDLEWDAKGRLKRLWDLDSQGNGYDWLAGYDALGRRLYCWPVLVTNHVAADDGFQLILQYYDPEAEFLQLGVKVQSAEDFIFFGGPTTWKLYGPDLSGSYGGMQGVGGLDAVIPGPNQCNPVVSDARGNILGSINSQQSTIKWIAARPTGYGAVPGYRPLSLGNGANVVEASAWRGVWSDISGLYWLGARFYDPVSGRFLSADPVWNGRDPNYYSFCGGDPINYFDADGRLATEFYRKSNVNPGAGKIGFVASTLDQISSATSSPTLAGTSEFISHFLHMAVAAGSPSAYTDQAAYDYDAAGGGVVGGLGIVNRYNPTKPFYDVFSGIDLVDAHELSGVERTSAGLTAFGSTVLVGTSVVRPPVTAANNAASLAAPGSRVTIGGVEATEIAGRMTPAQMAGLQAQHGTEFAQIYLTGPGRAGGGGTYYMIQGAADSVQIPIGTNVRLINHMHPQFLQGGLVPLQASGADLNVMRLLQQAGSPQRTSQIVPEVATPFNFRR